MSKPFAILSSNTSLLSVTLLLINLTFCQSAIASENGQTVQTAGGDIPDKVCNVVPQLCGVEK